MTVVEERIVARIGREGPLPFDAVVDEALYGEGGFYATGGGAGRSGADFLTSPEVGPLFGACVARALDAEWRALDEPSVFVVVEGGAGAGTLCRSILAAGPACAPALRYVLVERSPALRGRAASALPVEPAAQVLGGTTAGPVVALLADLPPGPLVGFVLANELLDNLPPQLARRDPGGEWEELRVGVDATGALTFEGWPAPPAVAVAADRFAGDPPPGSIVPVPRQAQRWVQRARASLEAGRVVCLDYADATASLARRPISEWLRTYRGHDRGGHPLERLGEQDVTCEVPADQLAPESQRSQAEWLRAHGLDDLVEAARAAWHAAAAAPDLEALKARSRVNEAAALTDPAGLGAFQVLEWSVR